MTIVNIETGEVADVMTEADAQTITRRIRSLAEGIADRIDLLVVKVREAQAGHAHVALGYRSWTAYVEAEFAGMLPRLDREPRRELVTVLAETGMSTRAIAPVVGVSKDTVHRDLAPVSHETPGLVGNDGLTDAERAVDLDAFNAGVGCVRGEPMPVTGLDGKTYTRPSPKTKPARRALPDQMFDAVFDLGKTVDRVVRLADDDRFPQNAEKVAAKHRNDLLQAIDALQGVVNRLPSA